MLGKEWGDGIPHLPELVRLVSLEDEGVGKCLKPSAFPHGGYPVGTVMEMVSVAGIHSRRGLVFGEPGPCNVEFSRVPQMLWEGLEVFTGRNKGDDVPNSL